MSSSINFKNCSYISHPKTDTTNPMVMNSPLTRQSSIYTLTFDELQNTLGGSSKDFGSMNMDELLKIIWTAEETRAMTTNFDCKATQLQKQGSLTLPRMISQKTVDEVWRELVKENDVDLIDEPNLQRQQKQAALGEMTLEDFLHKAGVVPENNETQSNGRPNNETQSNGRPSRKERSYAIGFKTQNQNHGIHQQAVVTKSKNDIKLQKIIPKPASYITSSLDIVNKPQIVSHANGVSKFGKNDHSIDTTLRPRSPSPPYYGKEEGDIHDRNRSGGTLEKLVERRRKRMIKNRESAARSRARKQAYTMELEAEIGKLKELNQELQKKQEEVMGSHNSQVPEKMKFWEGRRLSLRRTLSGPW